MKPHTDGHYQWIGHFTDHWSCFHILFPLATISTEEVAQNLCRHVFSVFGIPRTLFCNLGRQYATQLIQAVTKEWAGEVETEVGTQRVPSFSVEQASCKLEEMIAERVQEKPLWSQWLPFVQCECGGVWLSLASYSGPSQIGTSKNVFVEGVWELHVGYAKPGSKHALSLGVPCGYRYSTCTRT